MGNFATPVTADAKNLPANKATMTSSRTAKKSLGLARKKALLPFGPSLTYSASKLPGGKEGFIEFARIISLNLDHPMQKKFQMFVHKWDEATMTERRYISLEDLCAAGDIPLSEIFGEVAKVAFQQAVDVSAYIAAVELPNVVAASVRHAKKNSFFDRQMLMQGAGVAPTPKGTTINMNQSNSNNAQSATVERGLPVFEDDSATISRAVRGNDSKQLIEGNTDHGLHSSQMSKVSTPARSPDPVNRDRKHGE
jgi:hypothetical protein